MEKLEKELIKKNPNRKNSNDDSWKMFNLRTCVGVLQFCIISHFPQKIPAGFKMD